MDKVDKDPGAELDYGFDWTDWLTGDEVIDAVDWYVPSDLVLFDEAFSDTVAVAWIRGGTVGKSYIVTCHMQTDSTPQRVDERSFIIKVKQR